MIVLHAAFYQDRLLVWAEPEAGKPVLLAAVAELGAEFKYPKRAAGKAAVWLPARKGKPAPSSALLSNASPSNEECSLAPSIVTTLPLRAAQAVDLLAACVGKRMLAPSVLIGEDLAYWTAALHFAAGLVTRGQFLPGEA